MPTTFTSDETGEKFEFVQELYDYGHKGYVIKPLPKPVEKRWKVTEVAPSQNGYDYKFRVFVDSSHEQAEVVAEAIKALLSHIHAFSDEEAGDTLSTLESLLVRARETVQRGSHGK